LASPKPEVIWGRPNIHPELMSTSSLTSSGLFSEFLHTHHCSRITSHQAFCFLLHGSSYRKSCSGGAFVLGLGTAVPPLCPQP